MCLFFSRTQAFRLNQHERFRDQFLTFPFKTQNQTKQNFASHHKYKKINFINFFPKSFQEALKITCTDFTLTNFSRVSENKHKTVLL